MPDNPNQIPGQLESGGGLLDTVSSKVSLAATIYYADSPESERVRLDFIQNQPTFDRFGPIPSAPPVLHPGHLGPQARARDEEDFKEQARRAFVARRGNDILDQDFRYDYDRRRWVPKLQHFKTYQFHKYRGRCTLPRSR